MKYNVHQNRFTGSLALDLKKKMAAITLLRFLGRKSSLISCESIFTGLAEANNTRYVFPARTWVKSGFFRQMSYFTSEVWDETAKGETDGSSNSSGHDSNTEMAPKNHESPKSKLLRVAIIGEANSGKSTLTNRLIRQKICAVTSIPHTTRKQTLGVFVVGDSQIVLLDTPGIVTQTEARRLKMTRQHILAPRQALEDADLIAVITDVTDKRRSMQIHESILTALERHADKPSILILNKVDRIKHKMILLNMADALLQDREKDDWGNYKGIGGSCKFEQVFMISASSGDGVEDVKQYFALKSKPSEWLFPPDVSTDQPLEEQMQEIFREKLLQLYEHEIPWQIRQVGIQNI